MIYAIDFGTSNSLLGAVDKDRIYPPIALDPSAKDSSIMRTILYFPDQHSCFYGQQAIDEYAKHDLEGRFIRSFKKFLPMRSFTGTYVGNRPIALEEIIATFLGELRRRANAHFGKDVDSVLLGRPARFAEDDAEDQLAQSRLETAARHAGFKNIRFCPEPVAAAYEFRTTLSSAKTVLVADFGGGTSDFTVARLEPGKRQEAEVLSIGGIALAGDSLDACLMRKRIARHFGAEVQYKVPFGSNVLTMPKYFMEKICTPAEISLLRQRDTMEFFRNVKDWSLGAEDRHKMECLFSLIEDQIGFELFEEIERTKRSLSEKNLELFSFHKIAIAIDEEIERREFTAYTEANLDKILHSLDETVKNSGLEFSQIDLVCATGGTAKVPALRDALIQRFGSEKVQAHQHFHSIVHGLTHVARDLYANF